MAKPKFDGVIEAAHFDPDGRLAWVRAYERRGPTFSDHVLIDRARLVASLKAGKRFVIGKRIPYLASTFETSQALKLVNRGGKEILTLEDQSNDSQDSLKGVPIL